MRKAPDIEHLLLALAIVACAVVVIVVVCLGKASELATLLGAAGGLSGISGIRALLKPSPRLGPDVPFSNLPNDLGVPSPGFPVEIATAAPPEENAKAKQETPTMPDTPDARVTPRIFAHALLTALGVPITQNNVEAIIAAEALEGGWMHNVARFNPLNTSQRMPGSFTALTTPVAIQGYASWDEGLRATATTFKNGMYGEVLAALQASAAPDDTLKAIQLGPWGWYKIVNGVKVPNAIEPAAALQGEADWPFPAGGGSLLGGLGGVVAALLALWGASKL